MRDQDVITRLVELHDHIQAPATPADEDALRGERLVRRRRTVSVVAVAASVVLAVGIAQASLSDGRRDLQPTPAPSPPTPAASGALAYALDGDIYVADPDGSNAVNIADAPDPGCYGYEGPSWSPDGMYLAFWHLHCVHPGQGLNAADVVITDPDGNVVAEVPAEGWGFAWSPDSTRVAVWGTFGETIDVYGVDGEQQASLPLPPRMYPHNDSGPGVWMPDGSALLLYGSFVVPLDGSAPHDLSLGGHDLDGAASYSPDGTRVAVGGQVDTDHSITVIDADGSPVSEVDGPPSSDALTWSPDGDRFATLSDDGHIFVVDVASGTATVLPEADAAIPVGWQIGDVPAFSPEGDRILYTAIDGAGLADLWSIGVDGSDARLVVDGTAQGEWLSPGRPPS